jgi:hypothetical protein
MKSNKRPVEVSPVGTVEFAWLNHPQPPHPRNKDPKAKSKYSVTLSMAPNDPAVKTWGAAVKAIKPDADKFPFKIDKETGKLLVKFSSVYAPQVVDAKRNLLPPGRYPAKGSEVRVAYVADEYETDRKGITLYLQGVQVLRLVEFERKPLPFADEEGFVRDPSDLGAPPPSPETGGQPRDEEPPPGKDDDSDLPF